MDLATELGKCTLFRQMPAASLAKLAAIAEARQLAVGTEVLHEDKPVTAIYAVVLGTVRVLKREQRGKVEEIARLGTGSYLGELEFAAGDATSAASVETAEPTTLLVLAYDRLRALCDADKDLAAVLYQSLARGLARRLANTNLDAAHYRSIAVHKT